MLSCLFTLHCLLEAPLFVYRTKPYFFYFFNLTVMHILYSVNEGQSPEDFTNCLDMRLLLFFNCWHIIFYTLN